MILRITNLLFLVLAYTFVEAQTIKDNSFINPTGSYKLNRKVIQKGDETYGYFGEISIKLLDSTKFAINFFVCKGAPSYNSGSFGDTLEYSNNKAIYKTSDDVSCRMTFTFSRKGVNVVEETNDFNSGCGFGHAVVADGFYKKTSSKVPKIENPY